MIILIGQIVPVADLMKKQLTKIVMVVPPRTINWAISKDVTESFANEIMKIIKEENYE